MAKKIKVKEITPKIKIIEKKESEKNSSVLEREVSDNSDNFIPSSTSARAIGLQRSNEVQVVQDVPSQTSTTNQDPEFMMSRSYSTQTRTIPSQNTRYQSINQSARNADPGLTQNNFSSQQERPNRFRSQELDSMGGNSLPDSKYQELESLPEDNNKNKRRLPWEI